MKTSILHSLDAERAADILEEMDPAEAADALADLEEESRREIVQDMEREARRGSFRVAGLSRRPPRRMAMMSARFFAIREDAVVGEAVRGLRADEALLKRITNVFLVDGAGRLSASAPLGRILVAEADCPLRTLAFRETVKVALDADRGDVVELFDKYNLYSLPVVDEDGRLEGVITADDVIAELSPEVERGL